MHSLLFFFSFLHNLAIQMMNVRSVVFGALGLPLCSAVFAPFLRELNYYTNSFFFCISLFSEKALSAKFSGEIELVYTDAGFCAIFNYRVATDERTRWCSNALRW